MRDLGEQWRHAAQGKTIASFDCFDTLLWRGTQNPADVFCELARDATFTKYGFSGLTRSKAEIAARRRRFENGLAPEVTLEEIYQELLPVEWPTEVSACVEAELAVEVSFGFTFSPIVDMMRAAKRRDMQVIVVSDTYFSAGQLRRLLLTIDPDLTHLIDFIFCSSDYRVSKTHGLWTCVLDELAVSASSVLHVGDNAAADVAAAGALGIDALYFQREDEVQRRESRRRSMATRMLLSGAERETVALNLYSAIVQTSQPRSCDSSEALGWNALGPTIYAFSAYLSRERLALARSAGSVKFGFLMRDAHLFREASALVEPDVAHPALCISRQTAVSASFDSARSISNFIRVSAIGWRLTAEQFCNCLLLEGDERTAVTEAFECVKYSLETVLALFTPEFSAAIVEKSRRFRQRLFRHIERETGIVPGDTLCLVDVGYNGTIQALLADIMKRHWNITVVGRYLIAAENVQLIRRSAGLIDSSWADQGLIHALTLHGVASIERLCSMAGGIVMDYDEEGNPIKGQDFSEHPSWIGTSQRAALAFVKKVHASGRRHLPELTPSRLRESAVAALGRMLFLPSCEELTDVAEMEADVNIGSSVRHDVCNLEKGIKGLRRRGLFYTMGGGEFRSNPGFELRFAGLDQLLLYIASVRNGLQFAEDEYAFRSVVVPAEFRFDRYPVQRCLQARATFDGFYALIVPLGQFESRVAIGKLTRWFELESVTSFPAEAYGHMSESDGPHLRFEGEDYDYIGITHHAGDMLECDGDGAIVFHPLPGTACDYARLVFRPTKNTCRPDVQTAEVSGLFRHNVPSLGATRQCEAAMAPVPYERVIDERLHALATVQGSVTWRP